MTKQSKKRIYKKIFVSIFLLAVLAGSLFLFINRGNNNNENVKTNRTNNSSNNSSSTTNNSNTIKSGQHAEIPAKLLLAVPFTPQAPTANWDELHNEACEEASMIMVNAYYDNISSLPPAIVEKEITKLTEWQKENLGYNLSINTSEAARMAKEVYGIKTEIVEFNIETIKQALADNKLVVYPAMGQMLGNPNFTGDGPIYHMLVITGYDGNGNFITNDPGTKRGLNYKYSYETLEAAAGNWVHSAHAVDTTDKRIILVSK